MPLDQITDDTANPQAFPAVPASMHQLRADDRTVLPVRPSLWPLAPWRAVILLIGLGIVITCGPAAAAPIWNGADLAVLIGAGLLVAAFTPWGRS